MGLSVCVWAGVGVIHNTVIRRAVSFVKVMKNWKTRTVGKQKNNLHSVLPLPYVLPLGLPRNRFCCLSMDCLPSSITTTVADFIKNTHFVQKWTTVQNIAIDTF